ncbi:MAG: peptidoglycan-binding domain-containing protein [Roseinatronobacter sp.]
MSNKFAFSLSLSSLLVAGALVISQPAAAQGVEVGRAAGQPALLELPRTQGRQCWARYSTHGAKPQEGVIEERAFRVPCPEIMSQDFIATLQRALAARGAYEGPITGRADQATRAAVQAFQRANGFNSPILTLETAQRLGLVPADLAGH